MDDERLETECPEVSDAGVGLRDWLVYAVAEGTGEGFPAGSVDVEAVGVDSLLHGHPNVGDGGDKGERGVEGSDGTGEGDGEDEAEDVGVVGDESDAFRDCLLL